MQAIALCCVLLISSALAVDKSKIQAAANPIRRVVNLLQDMQKKVEAEATREKELF